MSRVSPRRIQSRESTVSARIALAIGALDGVRLFRNNTGTAWQGERLDHPEFLILRNPRPVHFGLCVGSSDYVGWRSLLITPDMIGERVAQFLALEVKDRGVASAEQLNFVAQVQGAGGCAGVPRSAADALALVNERRI